MEEENDSCPLIKTDECTFAYIKVMLTVLMLNISLLNRLLTGEQRVHRGNYPEQYQHRDAVQSAPQDLSGSRHSMTTSASAALYHINMFYHALDDGRVFQRS